MKLSSKRVAWVLVLGLAGELGCAAGEPSWADDDVLAFRTGGQQTQAKKDQPGTGGTWLGNGLQNASVSGLDPAFDLDTGLDPDGDLLSTSAGIEVARYVVECALPAGESIEKTVDGQLLELDGLYGLTPQWGTGACDEECQQWVSACMLARTNVTAANITVWASADNPAIGLGTSPNYPVWEGSFFGNLFASTPRLYFCYDEDTLEDLSGTNGRACSSNPEACDFAADDECDDCTYVGGIPVECDGLDDDDDGTSYPTVSTFIP